MSSTLLQQQQQLQQQIAQQQQQQQQQNQAQHETNKGTVRLVPSGKVYRQLFEAQVFTNKHMLNLNLF